MKHRGVKRIKILAKTSAILVAAGLILLTVAGSRAGAGGQHQRTPSGIADADAPAPQKSGAAIYKELCATCHGADGRAKTARGKRKGATDLTKSRISYRRGIQIITDGKSRMPDFAEELSTAEIRRVNSYIRRFRTSN